jgi:hypothetical protein
MVTAIWEGSWEELVTCPRKHNGAVDDDDEDEEDDDEDDGDAIEIYEDEDARAESMPTKETAARTPRRARRPTGKKPSGTKTPSTAGRAKEQAALDRQLQSILHNDDDNDNDGDKDPNPATSTDDPLAILGGPKTIWYLIKMTVRGIGLCRIICPWFMPIVIRINQHPGQVVWTDCLRIDTHDLMSWNSMLLGGIVIIEEFLELCLRQRLRMFRSVNEQPGPSLLARVICLVIAGMVTLAFCFSIGYHEHAGRFVAFFMRFWYQTVGGNWDLHGEGGDQPVIDLSVAPALEHL